MMIARARVGGYMESRLDRLEISSFFSPFWAYSGSRRFFALHSS